MFWTKEQGEKLKKIMKQINNLPDKEFKALVIKNDNWIREKRRGEHSENFNMEIKKYEKEVRTE